MHRARQCVTMEKRDFIRVAVFLAVLTGEKRSVVSLLITEIVLIFLTLGYCDYTVTNGSCSLRSLCARGESIVDLSAFMLVINCNLIWNSQELYSACTRM